MSAVELIIKNVLAQNTIPPDERSPNVIKSFEMYARVSVCVGISWSCGWEKGSLPLGRSQWIAEFALSTFLISIRSRSLVDISLCGIFLFLVFGTSVRDGFQLIKNSSKSLYSGNAVFVVVVVVVEWWKNPFHAKMVVYKEYTESFVSLPENRTHNSDWFDGYKMLPFPFPVLRSLIEYAMQTHFGKCGKTPNKYVVRDACVGCVCMYLYTLVFAAIQRRRRRRHRWGRNTIRAENVQTLFAAMPLDSVHEMLFSWYFRWWLCLPFHLLLASLTRSLAVAWLRSKSVVMVDFHEIFSFIKAHCVSSEHFITFQARTWVLIWYEFWWQTRRLTVWRWIFFLSLSLHLSPKWKIELCDSASREKAKEKNAWIIMISCVALMNPSK